jgi:phosphoribosylaminoimidazolecarboxamide formyltransferase/IMP cyclohydrolase
MDDDSAAWLTEHASFFEVIIAPSFAGSSAEILSERWKNVRLLELGRSGSAPTPLRVKSVPGGLLVQDADAAVPDPFSWTRGAGPEADERTLRAASLVWLACKHLTSNAIAIGGVDLEMSGVRLFGGGAGQMDRVASCELAIRKAGDLGRIELPIAASDAFFPFADGPERLIDAGVKVLVQPGGSKRDDDTFRLCEERGVTCLLTGIRHFRH